jgi:hypothetical protein
MVTGTVVLFHCPYLSPTWMASRAAAGLRVAGQTGLSCHVKFRLRRTCSAKGFSNKSLISQNLLHVFHSLSARIGRVNQGCASPFFFSFKVARNQLS